MYHSGNCLEIDCREAQAEAGQQVGTTAAAQERGGPGSDKRSDSGGGEKCGTWWQFEGKLYNLLMVWMSS